MDAYVIRAMARWPDVPAVYGWLALDRRGDWRIKGERVGHRKAVDFINRNYAADEWGRWFFQNGPQRVFVQLEYTPWVYRLDANEALCTQTGGRVERIDGVYLDDEGNLLLDAAKGVGVVDDRDLVTFSAHLRLSRGGGEAEGIETAVLAAQSGNESDLVLRWREQTLKVDHVPRASVASRFGFNPNPGSEAERN